MWRRSRRPARESVVTGNYNRDLNLLIKAANDAGLNVRFDTFLSHLIGGPTAIGAAGENRLTSIMEFNGNVPVDLKVPEAEKFANEWRTSGHDTDFSTLNFVTMIDMLTDAINKAGSTDPLKVALALEDMHGKDLLGQEVIMRKDDHQLLMPYYAGVFSKDVKYDSEHTGFGWKNYMTASTAGPDAADHLQDEAAGMSVGARFGKRGLHRMEIVLVSLLNGLVYGMLLFMLASGLTLIFSMMGVLNFAHASIYMIGAYLAFTISQYVGFFPALIIAPILCGLLGAAIEVLGCAASIPTAISPNCSSPSVSCSSSGAWCR